MRFEIVRIHITHTRKYQQRRRKEEEAKIKILEFKMVRQDCLHSQA